MHVVIDRDHSLVCEKESVGVVDIHQNRFELVLKVPDETIRMLLHDLNEPLDTETPLVCAMLATPLFRNAVRPYCEFLDTDTYPIVRAQYDRVIRFVEENRAAFEITPDALWSLVKRTVFHLNIHLIGDLLQSVRLRDLRVDCGADDLLRVYTDDSLSVDAYDHLFIIDLGSTDPALLRDFEQRASRSHWTRMYVGKTSDQLIVGPTLVGRDYGCLYCDGTRYEAKPDQEDVLLQGVLERECLKVAPHLLESAIKDNNLTVGKRFEYNIFDGSADLVCVSSDNACAVHKFTPRRSAATRDTSVQALPDGRFKDLTPEQTVAGIKEHIAELGLNVIERNHTNSCGFHAVLLNVDKTDLFVNGKGGTSILAMASAYGELMERIHTGVLFRYRLREYPDAADPVGAEKTYFCADECLFDSDQYHDLSYFGEGSPTHRSSDATILFEKALAVQQNYLVSDRVVHEPFYRLSPHGDSPKEEIAYFPVSVCDAIYGTNGMSYGNTPEEAGVQALSEIFERYVNRRVIMDRQSLPVLSETCIDSTLLSKVRNTERTHGLSVTFLDASLGQGFPVVAVVAENREGDYFVKFGSHFNLSVAAERCLTELFQGRSASDPSFLKKKVYLDHPDWQRKNLEIVLHTGDGFYPLEFFDFGKEQSAPWPLFDNNKEAFEYMKTLLHRHSNTIYFKQYYAGCGHVVRFLVPGMSELSDRPSDSLEWQIQYGAVREKLATIRELTREDFELVLEFIRHNVPSGQTPITEFLPHNINRQTKLGALTLDGLADLYKLKINDEPTFLQTVERLDFPVLETKDVLSYPLSYESNIVRAYRAIRGGS